MRTTINPRFLVDETELDYLHGLIVSARKALAEHEPVRADRFLHSLSMWADDKLKQTPTTG